MPDRRFFPWASVIRFGLGHLRLAPDVFWRLSLPELNALLGADESPEKPTRHGLDALMALFPDTTVTPVAATSKDSVDDR